MSGATRAGAEHAEVVPFFRDHTPQRPVESLATYKLHRYNVQALVERIRKSAGSNPWGGKD